MNTWQYLWRPDGGEGRAQWASGARAEVPRKLQPLGLSQAWLHLTEERPPWLSLIPFRRGVLGLVTVHGERREQGTLALDALRGLGGSWAGYQVTEAQPVPREISGPPGSASPGVCLLTLFRRKKGLTRDALLKRWHGGHTPLSIEIHPFVSYVRCTVEAPLSSGDPPWDGIVTESCATRRELLNPLLLFGGPLRAPYNMVRVGLDIHGFMDLKTMESYLVTEYALF